MTSFPSLSLGACAIAALLLGCGGSDEPVHTITSTNTSEASGAQTESTHSRQSQGPVELPEDFPRDVPVYSPSTLKEVLVGDGKHAASFTAEASSQEVASFYRKQFRDHSWNVEEAVEFDGQVMLSGTKQGRKISVFIIGRKELTRVAVSVSSS